MSPRSTRSAAPTPTANSHAGSPATGAPTTNCAAALSEARLGPRDRASLSFPRTLFRRSGKGPSLSERDCSVGPPQGRCAPADAGRLRRSLPRPAAAVLVGVRSGRSNGPFDRTKQLGLEQPSSWRMVGQGGVWPFGIVMVEPGRQGGVALPRGRIGPGIGPLAQAGLNEPLGLAVGARRVRPGAFVSEPSGRQRRPESLAEIGRTVIGHDPFDGHPLPGKPAEGALEKADRAVLALVRQDLAVSQPGRVIDAHM